MFVQRALLLITLSSLVACDRSAPPAAKEEPAPAFKAAAPPPAPVEPPPKAPIQGWERIIAAEPRWRDAYAQSELDPELLKALNNVDPIKHASVYIIFGTWCGDSLREIPTLMKHLLQLNKNDGRFYWATINVDRSFYGSPPIDRFNVTRVPTVIVSRGDKEIGRIVETAPNGMTQDLLSLLNGSASGVLSASPDLQ
jgi:hypothetical protein